MKNVKNRSKKNRETQEQADVAAKGAGDRRVCLRRSTHIDKAPTPSEFEDDHSGVHRTGGEIFNSEALAPHTREAVGYKKKNGNFRLARYRQTAPRLELLATRARDIVGIAAMLPQRVPA